MAQLDSDAPSGQMNLNEVQAGQEAVSAGEVGGREAVASAGASGEARREGRAAREAGLHLDQDEVGGGGGDQVELCGGVAQVAGQDTVPRTAQVAGGEALAGAAALGAG